MSEHEAERAEEMGNAALANGLVIDARLWFRVADVLRNESVRLAASSLLGEPGEETPDVG